MHTNSITQPLHTVHTGHVSATFSVSVYCARRADAAPRGQHPHGRHPRYPTGRKPLAECPANAAEARPPIVQTRQSRGQVVALRLHAKSLHCVRTAFALHGHCVHGIPLDKAVLAQGP